MLYAPHPYIKAPTARFLCTPLHQATLRRGLVRCTEWLIFRIVAVLKIIGADAALLLKSEWGYSIQDTERKGNVSAQSFYAVACRALRALLDIHNKTKDEKPPNYNDELVQDFVNIAIPLSRNFSSTKQKGFIIKITLFSWEMLSPSKRRKVEPR